MTRLELEARRMQAIPLLDSSMMQAKIARTFGVSRTTVSRWKLARAKGNSLKQKLASGRPSRMSAMEIERCKSIYSLAPWAAGTGPRQSSPKRSKIISGLSTIPTM